MANGEDTAALVAAQLTTAWATRMGPARPDEAGDVGPRLLSVYAALLEKVTAYGGEIDSWIAAHKRD